MSQRVTIAQALEIAVQHHNAGQLSEAKSIYEQILAAEPQNHDALHLLGLIANENGENTRAADLIEQAIAIAPNVGEMHGNLALVYQDLGRPDDAVGSFQKALELNPDFAEGHNNLGLALQDIGQLDGAVASFSKAVAINPEFAEAHSNLGNAYKELGLLDDATASHQRAIELAPGFAQAHNNLGSALQAVGRLDEAIERYKAALDHDPNYAEAHTNLGSALQELGRLDEAIACYREALTHDPDLAEALGNLGVALTEQGMLEEALSCHRKAVASAPQNDALWMGLAACVEVLTFESVDGDLLDDLLQLLEHPAINPQSIAPPILSALRAHPGIAAILDSPSNGDVWEAAETLSAIPLLLRVMTLSPLKDLDVEAMLTGLRRKMLETMPTEATNETGLAFFSALARHCFLNEYVFGETANETAAVDRLERDIGTMLNSEPSIPPLPIIALSAYKPLYRVPFAEKLLQFEFPDDAQSIITQQISESLEEQRLRAELTGITDIEDSVSRSVRAQYEENPYPRWQKFAAQHRPASIGDILRGAPLRFDVADYHAPDRPEILIAGCGTGQQALLAVSRYRNAQILAVDLSLSSLSYAMRKTHEQGVKNIDYRQGDILGLQNLDRRFDLIECVGVLHHMADPLAGWRVLVDLLNPGGVMKLGLYSETARKDVIVGRALIAEQGYESTPEGIRRCREHVVASAQEGDADMAQIVARNSFYTTSECRDLLFHVQEHRFTLPQIDAALQDLSLDFLGFEFGDPRTKRRFAGTPNALSDWHQFEQEHPQTFSGMYQFWVQKR